MWWHHFLVWERVAFSLSLTSIGVEVIALLIGIAELIVDCFRRNENKSWYRYMIPVTSSMNQGCAQFKIVPRTKFFLRKGYYAFFKILKKFSPGRRVPYTQYTVRRVGGYFVSLTLSPYPTAYFDGKSSKNCHGISRRSLAGIEYRRYF
jgi:hypothetical protein